MSELRRDPIVGRWVIVKTDDYLKPTDYVQEDNSPRHADTSPFMHGKENRTPPEVAAIRPAGSAANSPGWNVRVVPNKFPALRIEGDLDKHGAGIYDMSNGVGAHEVLIETPDPVKQMADFTCEETHQVVQMYHRRCIDLSGDPRFKYILIFKNYGESAGTSLYHAHSQIIALPMVPKIVQEKLSGAENYHRFRGRSIYGDMIHQEYEEKERIVTDNDDFVVFCPFVPRYSFECWIMPKNERSRFSELTEKEQYNLACILRETLYRIKQSLSDPSYNFYLHVAPVNYGFEETFLWHIEILPQLSRISGFEWGMGLYVVQTPPDVAAKYLREVEYK